MSELTDYLGVLRIVEPVHDSLEDRVSALENRRELHDLILRYGSLCDARAWDELLECYCEDVERILAGTLYERVVGKDELRRRYITPTLTRSDRSGDLASPKIQSLDFLHVITNEIIRLSSDGVAGWAAARGQLIAWDDGSEAFRTGSHRATWIFEFRKEGTAWKIGKLTVYSDSGHNPMFTAADT